MDHDRPSRRHRPSTPDGASLGDANEAALRIDDQPSSGLNPELAATRSELDRIVDDQLGRLPDKYRLPLVYAAIEELDYGTIARMLKVRRGTVKTLVFRGRHLLKERVDAVLALKGGREAHAD